MPTLTLGEHSRSTKKKQELSIFQCIIGKGKID